LSCLFGDFLNFLLFIVRMSFVICVLGYLVSFNGSYAGWSSIWMTKLEPLALVMSLVSLGGA